MRWRQRPKSSMKARTAMAGWSRSGCRYRRKFQGSFPRRTKRNTSRRKPGTNLPAVRYLPKSDIERREMLRALGVDSLDALFAHLPNEVRLNRTLNIPPGQSEYEIVDYFRARGEDCAHSYASFLGAGVYRHYRPVLVDTVVSRSEFLTSYTPYQAEISQGTLTTIFEFQTMICQLTGMEVANASMYDGSTAVPEAAMMAMRLTGRDRILLARSVHPEYREVLATYAQHHGMLLAEVDYVRDDGGVDLSD